jgi:hypothetical protein
MAAVRPRPPPSRRLTITLAPETYRRVVHLAAVDDRPGARMRAGARMGGKSHGR